MGVLKIRLLLHRLFMGFLLLWLTACASNSTVQTQLLRLQTTPDLNQNRPIAVDLVMVYDAHLMQALQKLSAKQWMRSKQQFKRDYPLLLKLWEWEPVPGEVLPDFELPSSATKQAAGILVFADYDTPGLHRARLDPFDQVLIKLGKNDMQLYADF